jgi:TonB-dependent receptor
MSHTNRLVRKGIHRQVFESTATAASLALMLLGASGAAYADQQADSSDEAIETIEVTGIRHAIQTAIEEKKNNGSIVEAITAEDIGKLPDTSIAESISRLPGLTSQRANGRASAISLRGTDPAFTTALLNGREQVSTGDNRSVEFDQYPSELLSSVVVYKTPDAQLVGQGLAGTIDLRTQRPLDYGKRAIVFNIRGERNSNNDLGANSTDKGYRVSFSYIDQFADNTFGLTFGYARLDQPLATQGVGMYEPWHVNEPGPNGADDFNYHASVPIGTIVSNGMKIRTDMGKNVRDGAMAALQWKPTDSFQGILDLYYTKSTETDDARSLEWNLGNYPATTDYSNLVIVDNTLVGATVENLRPLARNFQFITDDKILATGLNLKWDLGDWGVVGDVSYSDAKRDQFQPETNAQFGTCANGGDPACTDTGTFLLSSGSKFPTASFGFDYADPDNVAFGPTIYGPGYVKKPHVEDKLKSGRIDVTRKLDTFVDSIGFGINYADRSKDKISPESGLSTIDPGAVFIGDQYLMAPTNLSYGGAGIKALAWSVPGVLATYYQPIVYGDPESLHYLVGKWWTVNEKVTTGYVRGNLNYELSSNVTLKGNIGLQLVHTDQSSDAFFLDTVQNTIEPFTEGRTYNDVLPALNFAFALPGDQAVRVGLAREIARARMDQLKASTEIGCNRAGGNQTCGGDRGNPNLAPWRADAYDLSYEKYFSKGGYFSAAAFYKKLKTYIYPLTDGNHDFSDFIATLPTDYFDDGAVVDPTGNLTQPVNGNGGNVKGVELSVSLPGELLTDSLHGFGTILSWSHTDSSIKIFDTPGTGTTSGTGFGEIPLPGLSKNVWNATLYYENYGFSARIAARARSKYIGEITNFANDRAFRFIKGDTILDFQTGYEFGEGRFHGLSILFQVNNLTDEPYVAYAVDEARLIDYQTYGRQFLFGINYKL